MSDKKYTSSANYALIGKNEKPETKIELEKVPEVKKIILEILLKDKEFWDNCKQRQQGIEKFNLLSKVSSRINMNSNIFYIALDELEGEQKVLPEIRDNKVRYSAFSIKN
jgi:hypothetical protein